MVHDQLWLDTHGQKSDLKWEVKMKNWIGSFIHNCIAHPIMPFLPKKWGEAFHDWTIKHFWPPWDPEDDTEEMM